MLYSLSLHYTAFKKQVSFCFLTWGSVYPDWSCGTDLVIQRPASSVIVPSLFILSDVCCGGNSDLDLRHVRTLLKKTSMCPQTQNCSQFYHQTFVGEIKINIVHYITPAHFAFRVDTRSTYLYVFAWVALTRTKKKKKIL